MTYIAKYTFIFVRVIQPLNSSMTLVALEALVALIPPIKVKE